MSERSLISRTLIIDIYETYFEKPKKKKNEGDPESIQKEKFHGRAKLLILDALKFSKTAVFMLYLYDEKNKIKGKIYIQNFSIKCHYSFLDLYIKNSLNIIPVIGVDYSLANLTFGSGDVCIHTLKEGAANDYMDCLKSVAKSF